MAELSFTEWAAEMERSADNIIQATRSGTDATDEVVAGNRALAKKLREAASLEATLLRLREWAQAEKAAAETHLDDPFYCGLAEAFAAVLAQIGGSGK